MTSERIQINLRGYCFYCLKKISNEGDSNCYKSPACTPVPPSPLSTPLRTRCHNVHNLPPGERLAPFTDLCRYLGVDLPDCYSFGDGSDPDVLYPNPLCEKCHELSARLCVLQDELQYIQTRIQNTVERIHRRVASTCDKRGAIKREEFNKDFRRKSKGSLSRGRGENPEAKRVTDLLKAFQMRIAEKDYENRERKKRRATNVLFPEFQNSFAVPTVPNDADQNIMEPEPENEENVQPQSQFEHEELALSFQEYLPPEETLRSDRPRNIEQHLEIDNVQVQQDNKPYPDVSTIVYSFRTDESTNLHQNLVDDDNENNHLKTTLIVGVTTRSQTRVQQTMTNELEGNQLIRRNDNDNFIRRRTRKVAKY